MRTLDSNIIGNLSHLSLRGWFVDLINSLVIRAFEMWAKKPMSRYYQEVTPWASVTYNWFNDLMIFWSFKHFYVCFIYSLIKKIFSFNFQVWGNKK